MQAIVVRRKASSTIDPCILVSLAEIQRERLIALLISINKFPHGGPHGADLIQWGLGAAALCLAGCESISPLS